MQQQGIAALHVLLVNLHHQHIVGLLFDVSAVVVQLHHPVRLAQIAVGVIDVFHHETGVILAAHGVEIGTAKQVRHGGGQLDHLLGLANVIDPFAVDQQRAFRAVEQRFDQQRLQLVAAQIVEDLAHLKA